MTMVATSTPTQYVRVVGIDPAGHGVFFWTVEEAIAYAEGAAANGWETEYLAPDA